MSCTRTYLKKGSVMLSKIKKYRHGFVILSYFIVYLILFNYLEQRPVHSYHIVHTVFDDMIPFCEWFLIPYLFWFVYLIGTIVYTFFFDVAAFKRMMYFIIITYSITMLIYLVFPTCQNLRPTHFARDNVLTRFIAWFYTFDTNTNVCPSIHVLGSVAAMLGLCDCRRLQNPKLKLLFILLCVLICISTVFMKQHSVLDVLAALPLCVIAYPICYKAGRHEKVSAVQL